MEIEIMKQLDHPNIVKVMEAQTHTMLVQKTCVYHT